MVVKPAHIPSASGVYTFRRAGIPLYIGKAADLKKRLSSYFRANASEKVRQLRQEATTLDWVETVSEVEALIREAEAIKRHTPKFNVLMRDDKSYFYVVVTKEKFPKIFVRHKTGLNAQDYKRVIGPFTSGSALYATLRLLRRIFPYCTCKDAHKRPCLNAQIGRCPGYCCLVPSPRLAQSSYSPKSLIRTNKRIADTDAYHYRANIRHIAAVLHGRRKRLLSRLKSGMREASRRQDYEAAARLRDQIEGLENVFAHEHILRPRMSPVGRARRSTQWPEIRRVIATLVGTDKKISRVEGYDVSNVSGTAATGSMVVFIEGLPAKSLYRTFKIKTVRGANDVAMHREMMRRRLAHHEWGMPDLVLIDGGKPQINAVASVLRPGQERIRLAALAKREEELYIEGKDAPARLDALPREVMLFFQHVRDESHRFAKKYHHKLREISYRIS